MKVNYSSLTDVGRKRDHNEDFLLVDEELGLFIVCDGVGGHAAGEVASSLAAQKVQEVIASEIELINMLKSNEEDKSLRFKVQNVLRESVRMAHELVLSEADAHPEKKGMGTTIVFILALSEGALVTHVGDSRCYLRRENEIHQVTEDHSFVNEMLKAGIITPEQAVNHPQGNRVTQAIGIQENLGPSCVYTEVMSGDQFLLCSDGLSDYLDHSDILKLFQDFSLDELPSKFIDEANERGGKDNISSIVVQFEGGAKDQKVSDQVSIDKKISILKKVPLFKSLNYKEISQLLEVIEVKKTSPHDTLILADEVGDDMFIILKGKVSVIRGGKEVALLGPGAFFGEMGLIDKNPRNATIIAQEYGKVMRLGRGQLFSLLKREPRLGLKLFWSFLQNMNKELRQSYQKNTAIESTLDKLNNPFS